MTRVNVIPVEELTREHLVSPISEQLLRNALELNKYYILPTSKYLNVSRNKVLSLMKLFNIENIKMKGRMKKYKINNKLVNNIYYKIRNRCNNPKTRDYIYYGARGICLWDKWAQDRDLFAEYVMNLENFGKPGYSLDRIDNHKNYEPGNLKFSSKSEQANNTRRNIVVEYNGEKMTLMQFFQRYGKAMNFTYDYLNDRMCLGFTLEEAITIPKYAKRKYYNRSNQQS